ncbi:MAG: imidazole glycerol phosphate synthase subunit HisF [Candidatus Saccharicenans sp.]
MLTFRIIPCLDMDDGFVVKGIKFDNLVRVGDPVTLARKYYLEGADELIFLDVGATVKSRKTMIEVVEKVFKEIFIPLTAGGGIKNTQDIKNLLLAGADKVSLCTAAIQNPSLIEEAASLFGSQCVVISIDAARCGKSWHAFTCGGKVDSGLDAIEWAIQAEKLGAGEILLNSIDRDGTQTGYDLELLSRISEAVTIPVIASGGAGSLDQILKAITIGKADAVLLASSLHSGKLTISQVKNFLKEKGVNVR